MSDQNDHMGNPIDPEVRQLEFKLGDIAATWRGSYGNTQKQAELVKEYHAIVARLYDLGWDDVLDLESELPECLMPEEYIKRNPRIISPPGQWMEASKFYDGQDSGDENI